jgi:two-component system chemotaxis response regulator CheV
MMSQIIQKRGILLEAGTNELEIVEFILGSEYYGINVAKVREIIRGNCAIVPVPDASASVVGVVNLRGKIIPVVNLAQHLHIEAQPLEKTSRIIIAEFNRMIIGFFVSAVTRVHRLSWKQVESPTGLIQTKNAYAVGIIKIEDRIVFLLDFEKIASVINPASGIQPAGAQPVSDGIKSLRGMKKIMVVEDSVFVSGLLRKYLESAGYHFEIYNNGQQAWDLLEKISNSDNFRKIEDHYHLLITDLEMPQMDGLHLIKRIKDNLQLKRLPCVVFSSIISEEQALKCQSVGASGQVTKPDMDGLLKLVDSKIL